MRRLLHWLDAAWEFVGPLVFLALALFVVPTLIYAGVFFVLFHVMHWIGL